MHMDRDTFRVSCKIVLFNQDRTKVLLPEYKPGAFGLIGGHLDTGESPDDAIRREIKEELGINYIGPLKRVSFDLVNKATDSKIALAYHGELDETSELHINVDELTQIKWIDIDDIHSGKVYFGDYRQFIIL